MPESDVPKLKASTMYDFYTVSSSVSKVLLRNNISEKLFQNDKISVTKNTLIAFQRP